MTLRIHDIVSGTTVDGPGLRTSVYFAGCAHHCPDCHNPHTWDPDGGEERDIDELCRTLVEERLPVTFTGGDPLYSVGPLTVLAQKLKKHGLNIWCYTGFTYEAILASERLCAILPHIDVLVDGPYIAEKKSKSTLFRGSANQRLIDVRRSLAEEAVVEWVSDF